MFSLKKKTSKTWYVYQKTLGLAWKTLKKNRLRSFLTSLGIIIGSATIVLVIEMGSGASADIEAQYSNMSVTTILVNAPSTEGQVSKLGVEDIEPLLASEHIISAIPQLTGKMQTSTGSETYQAGILGSYPTIQKSANIELASGRFFTQEEEDDNKKVAVLGATVAEELYGSADAKVIGTAIQIGRKEFEIIGVMKYKGGTIGPVSVDDSIVMPYSSSYRYVLGNNGRFNLNLESASVESLDAAMADAGTILREQHGIRPGMTEDFRLRDMGANVQSAKESAATMSILLGSVGLIVLIVGGIGIMNVMHIIVKERTKEIGIRKAIGARNNHILFQFLVEAIILSVLSAVVGLVLASGIYWLLVHYDLSVVFVWWGYTLSFIFTVAIGVFFGYYPAMKASKLRPVDTLRYE